MLRTLLKIACSLFCVTATGAGILWAEDLPRVIYDLHELRYLELQTDAVIINVQRCLYAKQDKNSTEQVSAKAVRDLDELKQKINGLQLDESVKIPKQKLMSMINFLVMHFRGIENKPEAKIQEEAITYAELKNKYYKAFDKVIEQHEITPKWPKPFELEEAVRELLPNESDRDIYMQAMRFIKDHQYPEAFHALNGLYQKNESNLAVALCLRLRMSDCIFKNEEGALGDGADPDKALEWLEQIISTEIYIPLLYEAFYKWRTQYQALRYGILDLSEIPNWQYNEKRWRIYGILKRHLKENPDDSWAMVQMELLLELPNIERRGVSNNSSVSDLGHLYMGIHEKKEL